MSHNHDHHHNEHHPHHPNHHQQMEHEVEEAFGHASEPYQIIQEADESRDDFLKRLVDGFHQANGMTKREQVFGLLQSISQSAEYLSHVIAGRAHGQMYRINPLPGLFFQMNVLRDFFPIDDEAISKQRDEMVGMYFLTNENADNAIVEYAKSDVTAEKIFATNIDGVPRYVLRVTAVELKEELEAGQKRNINVGQLLWYFQQDPDAKGITEADWNPYYEAPTVSEVVIQQAANDSDADVTTAIGDDEATGMVDADGLEIEDDASGDIEGTGDTSAESFEDQPFVGAGAQPRIVSATFEPGEVMLEEAQQAGNDPEPPEAA